MQRDVENGGYEIGKDTEKSDHQHRDWRLREVRWLSTMIGGSFTMALVRATNVLLIYKNPRVAKCNYYLVVIQGLIN